MSLESKKVVFTRQIASVATWEMGFSEADNKGVSGLHLWKERPLYLPSNREPLDSAYISETFASSAVSQMDFFFFFLLKECRFMQMKSLRGFCVGETVVTRRGMRLKRATGSGRTFPTHNALWCLFTGCGGLWVVWGKIGRLLSFFCKAFHGHRGGITSMASRRLSEHISYLFHRNTTFCFLGVFQMWLLKNSLTQVSINDFTQIDNPGEESARIK